MRLTVNLEDDLYSLAKSLAIAENCSMSAAINRLLRQRTQPPTAPRKGKAGFPVARGKHRFTSEDVYQAEQV